VPTSEPEMKDYGFATHLLREGILSADQHRAVTEAMGVSDRRADTVALDLGLVSEATLIHALGRFHSSRPVTAVELASIGEGLSRIISPRIARRYEIVPFRIEGRKLLLANLNPENLQIEDELGLMTGLMVTSFVGLEVRVYEVLHRLYDLQMPPLIAGVLRRLANGEIGTTRAKGSHTPATSTKPVIGDDTSPPSASKWQRLVAKSRARGEAVAARELEISDEDLVLFPSLRHEHDNGGDTLDTPAAAPEGPVAGPVASSGGSSSDSAPETGTAEAATEAADLSPETLLARASIELQDAEMREDIADALLDFCAPFFRRRMTLTLHKDSIIGWHGAGEGIDAAAVKAISIPVGEPSVFSGLLQGTSFWIGGLPPMPRNLDLMLGLGDTEPRECIILPVTLRKKPVCFLYGDNIEQGVSKAPVAHLRRLVAKAGLAFEVYLLKGKIRSL
jgi:hypothetical protein